MERKMSLNRIYEKVGNLFILITMVIIFSTLSASFLKAQNLINVLRQVSSTAIVTVGFTMLLITGGLDLSIGSQIAATGIICGLLFQIGVWMPAAILIGILCATFIGVFNGFVIVKSGIPPMMATIAMMTALRGLVYILCKGYPIYDMPSSVIFMGQGMLFGIVPVPVIVMLISIIIGTIILNRTYIGRYFFAVGSNDEATRLCGIDVSKIKILSYGITGFLSGIAGLLIMGRISSAQPGAADGFEMDVLTAAVLGGVGVNGGRGSIPLAMLGVLVIGVLTNGMQLIGVDNYWQRLVKGAILLIVIVLDSARIRSTQKSAQKAQR
jgi:ribose/xylose/arabinose/galactoside ABC-type transport system permease subunit